MPDLVWVVGHLRTIKTLLGVLVAVGSVLLGGSLGVAALAEANAAPLAGDSMHG